MRQLFLAILIYVGATSVSAQDMASVFTSIPDQYIPQLENAWRKDLVDLYNAGKDARLQNTMNGYSSLQCLTNDYLLLWTTERSTVEMKLLPLVNNTYVVCLVSTVKGSVADSRIAFFTTEWEPLDTSDLFTEPASDWFIKPEADREDDQFQEAISYLDMDLVEYKLSADDQTLTATYTTPLYLDSERRAKVSPYLSDPHVYQWEKYHFK